MGKYKIWEELDREKQKAEEWVLTYTERKEKALEPFGNESGKWLRAVEVMESILSPKEKIFLECRRAADRANRKHRTNWILFVQRTYAAKLGELYHKPEEDFWKCEKTVCNWWRNMVDITLKIAYHTGCKF